MDIKKLKAAINILRVERNKFSMILSDCRGKS